MDFTTALLTSHEKPELTEKDFDDSTVWICHYLDQEQPELANKYLEHHLSKYELTYDRLSFLRDVKDCYEYFIYNYESDPSKEPVLRHYKKALKMLELAMDRERELEISDQRQARYDDSEMVLLVHYISKLYENNQGKLPWTDQAKICHILQGKSFSNITNTYCYELLRKAPSIKKGNVADLDSMKNLFESYGLDSIGKMIENDIRMEKNSNYQ